MADTLTFFFDFTSPYSYLASTQVEALARRIGAELEWVPTFLAGVMRATGNSPPATVELKGKHMARDLARWAAIYGVPLRWNPWFPFASQHALRAAAATATTDPARAVAFHKALFAAAWIDGDDLGDRAVLAKVARAAGVDETLAANATDDPVWKDALKVNTDRAVALGAFGMPAFEYAGDLYFGNDRLELIAARAARGTSWPVLLGADGSPMW